MLHDRSALIKVGEQHLRSLDCLRTIYLVMYIREVQMLLSATLRFGPNSTPQITSGAENKKHQGSSDVNVCIPGFVFTKLITMRQEHTAL